MTAPVQETANQQALQVSLSGFSLINSPRLNKGTAFSDHERDVFDLHGLLPPHVGSLEEQLERRMKALEKQPTPFAKKGNCQKIDRSTSIFLSTAGLGNNFVLLDIVFAAGLEFYWCVSIGCSVSGRDS